MSQHSLFVRTESVFHPCSIRGESLWLFPTTTEPRTPVRGDCLGQWSPRRHKDTKQTNDSVHSVASFFVVPSCRCGDFGPYVAEALAATAGCQF
jgi:hypothetical protein